MTGTGSLREAAARSERIRATGGPDLSEQLAIAIVLPSAEEIRDVARKTGIDMDADDALTIGHEARRVALGTLERKLTPPNPIARFVGAAAADPEDSARAEIEAKRREIRRRGAELTRRVLGVCGRMQDETWDAYVDGTVAEGEARSFDGGKIRDTLEAMKLAADSVVDRLLREMGRDPRHPKRGRTEPLRPAPRKDHG